MNNLILCAPIELCIEVTSKCNLNCIYCYNKSSPCDLGLQYIYNVLEIAKNIGVFVVTISGGEPYLHKHISEIIEKAYALFKNNMAIVSNGTLLNEMHIKQLYDLKIINCLQISLDSCEPEVHNMLRGMWADTVSTLDKIRDYKYRNNCKGLPQIGIVLSKLNAHSFLDTIKYVSNYANSIHLMNLMSLDSNTDAYVLGAQETQKVNKAIMINRHNNYIRLDKRKYRKKKNYIRGCTAGKTRMVITSGKDAIPCDIVRDSIVYNMDNPCLLQDVWYSMQKDCNNVEILCDK